MIDAQPSGEITAYIGIFQHQDAVGDGNSQRSAASTFACDSRHDGNLKARHLAQVTGDGFGLAAFFGAQARDRLQAYPRR